MGGDRWPGLLEENGGVKKDLLLTRPRKKYDIPNVEYIFFATGNIFISLA